MKDGGFGRLKGGWGVCCINRIVVRCDLTLPRSRQQSHPKTQINYGCAAAMRPRLCATAAIENQINNNPKNLVTVQVMIKKQDYQ